MILVWVLFVISFLQIFLLIVWPSK
jgi:hypothetical protein